jgi:hypothetical protein
MAVQIMTVQIMTAQIMTVHIMTVQIMTVQIMTVQIMTVQIMTVQIMTVQIMTVEIMLNVIFILDEKKNTGLNLDAERLLDLGRQDTTTQVTVSVTVHTTPQFRQAFLSILD